MDIRTIYFNEKEHKYTDNFGNCYISTTTLIGKYHKHFDTKEMARNCERAGLRGNPKYAGKTASMLIKEWADETKRACDAGNVKHDFLEMSVKNCNNYAKIEGTNFINDVIYTIPDIMANHDYGRLDLEHFIKTGVKELYPSVYQVIEILVQQGYRIYSEIGVYNSEYLISGLIDILFVKDNDFYILDWKTNKAPIRFDAGYFKKDNFGFRGDDYVYTNEYFYSPLHNRQASVGNKYTMQLSTYGFMVEAFGLNNKGFILAHLREEDRGTHIEKDIQLLPIDYWKRDVHAMFNHYNVVTPRNIQYAIAN